MIWMDTHTTGLYYTTTDTRESIIIVVVGDACCIEIIVNVDVDTATILDYPRVSNVFHFFLHAIVSNSIIPKVIIIGIVATASQSMHVKMILVEIIVIAFRVILSESILPIIVITLRGLTIHRLIAKDSSSETTATATSIVTIVVFIVI